LASSIVSIFIKFLIVDDTVFSFRVDYLRLLFIRLYVIDSLFIYAGDEILCYELPFNMR